MTWRATILTLFPDMFPGPLGVSLAGKALASGLWTLEARDIRDSATDRHRSVGWCCAPTYWRQPSMRLTRTKLTARAC